LIVIVASMAPGTAAATPKTIVGYVAVVSPGEFVLVLDRDGYPGQVTGSQVRLSLPADARIFDRERPATAAAIQVRRQATVVYEERHDTNVAREVRLLGALPASVPLPGAKAWTGEGTDPAFDWEASPAALRERQLLRDKYLLGIFKSTKTLAETTNWLKSALERYGHVKPTVYATDIMHVRFRGCTMEWRVRTDLGSVTQSSDYSVNLREVNLGVDSIRVFSEEVRFETTAPFTVVDSHFENGVRKSTRSKEDSWVTLRLRNDELMPTRVSWALVHAARLCGAAVSR
jgi:hypothetical protein